MSEERPSREQRQKRILHLARTQGAVRINALAEAFDVTGETIRRDLDELAERGLVQRTYGGATAQSLTLEPQVWERARTRVAERGLVQRTYGGATAQSHTLEPQVWERARTRVAERERIGRHAAGLIDPGDAVFVDCGSTTAVFARALAARAIALTAVTNCIPVASALGAVGELRVVLCPGDYVAREGGVYGSNTVDFLRRFTVDKAFIGAGGLTVEGPGDADTRGVWVKRTMLMRARRKVLLVDSSKFGLTQFETICPLADLDDVVTDARPDAPLRNALAEAGVRLHVTQPS